SRNGRTQRHRCDGDDLASFLANQGFFDDSYEHRLSLGGTQCPAALVTHRPGGEAKNLALASRSDAWMTISWPSCFASSSIGLQPPLCPIEAGLIAAVQFLQIICWPCW